MTNWPSWPSPENYDTIFEEQTILLITKQQATYPELLDRFSGNLGYIYSSGRRCAMYQQTSTGPDSLHGDIWRI